MDSSRSDVALSISVFLAVITVVVPALAFSGKRRLDEGFVFPRIPLYVESFVVQTLLLALAVYVSRSNRLPLPFSTPGPGAIFPATILLLVSIGLMLVSVRFSSPKTLARLMMIVPSTPIERVLWIGVSAAAAIAEETTYRGVLFTIFQDATSSWWVAAVLSSGFFALAHLVQGFRSVLIVGAFGLGFQYLVRITGSLEPAIAVHFLYDVATGLYLSWRYGTAAEPDDETTV